MAAQLVPLKVDAEKEGKALAKQYGVRSFPAILFVDSEGVLVARIRGYMPPESFSAEMTKALTLHKEMPAIRTNKGSSLILAVLVTLLALVLIGLGWSLRAARAG